MGRSKGSQLKGWTESPNALRWRLGHLSGCASNETKSSIIGSPRYTRSGSYPLTGHRQHLGYQPGGGANLELLFVGAMSARADQPRLLAMRSRFAPTPMALGSGPLLSRESPLQIDNSHAQLLTHAIKSHRQPVDWEWPVGTNRTCCQLLSASSTVQFLLRHAAYLGRQSTSRDIRNLCSWHGRGDGTWASGGVSARAPSVRF
jgi:hypothetical protein